jgi:hypothetical protein
MFAKLFNHCDKDLGGGSQPVCYGAVYIKSNMQIKNLRRVHTQSSDIGWGFDEVFAILSGWKSTAVSLGLQMDIWITGSSLCCIIIMLLYTKLS